MASYKKRHTLTARRLGQRAARRMALLSATVPFDQVEDNCYRETEFLGMAVGIAAEHLALQDFRTRNRFEAAVSKALDQETDRILSLIAPGSLARQ
jgi:hypothetical protein